ncbi:MAG: hypothetical protein M5U12_06080 [Verrucomicrobia bacterium]|nr:hypothetical protein [Verrucomicrobiota bacterium]
MRGADLEPVKDERPGVDEGAVAPGVGGGGERVEFPGVEGEEALASGEAGVHLAADGGGAAELEDGAFAGLDEDDGGDRGARPKAARPLVWRWTSLAEIVPRARKSTRRRRKRSTLSGWAG